jgi:transcriptional regulator with XRE-family HTH domain
MNMMTPENMAKKIKKLRQANGLTLEQVATVVGVGKSTVRKWETGMIANMKRDKIASLAKALGTTPAYLMGWDEDTSINSNNLPDEKTLTEEEKEWLDIFRRIPKASQPLARLLLDSVSQLPEERQQMALEMVRIALKK